MTSPKEVPKSSNAPERIIIFLVILFLFPLAVAFSFFASGTLRPVPLSFNFGNGTGASPENNLTSRVPRNESFVFPNVVPPSFPKLPEISLLVLAGIIVAFVLLFILTRIKLKRTKKLAVSREFQDERLELASILEDAASELTFGSEYRQTVLQCYKRISLLLEKKSAIDGRAMTAREFKRDVSKILNFESPYLDELTDLFEHARYSLEEISSVEAESASKCLLKLAELLKSHELSQEQQQS